MNNSGQITDNEFDRQAFRDIINRYGFAKVLEFVADTASEKADAIALDVLPLVTGDGKIEAGTAIRDYTLLNYKLEKPIAFAIERGI